MTSEAESTATKRRRFSTRCKFKIALKAVKKVNPLHESANEHGVRSNRIGRRQQQLRKEGKGSRTSRQVRTDSPATSRSEKCRYTLGGRFCPDRSHQAITCGLPPLSNTGRGAQFTAAAFAFAPEEAERLSGPDGRGRAHDNIFIERLRRSVNYADIHRGNHAAGDQPRSDLGRCCRQP